VAALGVSIAHDQAVASLVALVRRSGHVARHLGLQGGDQHALGPLSADLVQHGG